jgi:hypothetical protein
LTCAIAAYGTADVNLSGSRLLLCLLQLLRLLATLLNHLVGALASLFHTYEDAALPLQQKRAKAGHLVIVKL